MTAAAHPVQRPAAAKLLVIDPSGAMLEAPRSRFTDFLQRGDLVVANDAATIPASLRGVHRRTNQPIEVRLAARTSLAPHDVVEFSAIVFGDGDYRTRTEDRPLPPALAAGDDLDLGPLRATVTRLLAHPRFVQVRFRGSPDAVWRGLALHGRAIQYAHIAEPLALWDVWTSISSRPAAFEPPSAGFVLDWSTLERFHALGIEFATITHAAGVSSTGDPELDARLPFDEPYDIPPAAAAAIARARRERRRIVAIGTTVVRALEHAAARDGVVHAGGGVATQRIGPDTLLTIVDVILSGVHEPGTSHSELLRAFMPNDILRRADELMRASGFRTHEFGDSVLIARSHIQPSSHF